jgi:2'-5' RNA ligase
MSKIAVDIVLLPDTAVAEATIAANRDLIEKHGRHIVLDEEHLPHISLAMGCIEASDVEPAEQVFAALAQECPPGQLTITGVATTLNARGLQVSSFILAQTDALQTLHARVMTAMEPYFSYDVTAEMIYGNEDVAETTLAWIRNYREKAAFNAFFPHITIGYGDVARSMSFPMPCTPSTLAICHLGNHCTCRKVLMSVVL